MRYLAAVLILSPLGAGAQSEPSDPVQGFYAGAGIGDAEPTSWDTDYWYSDIDSGDSDTSLSVFAGYRFNRYLAAEVGWFEGGTMGWDQTLVYVPDLLDVYNTDVDLEVTAVNASAIGILPFARIWEVYLRGGLAYYDADAQQRLTPSFGGVTVERGVDDSSVDLLFGFGVGVTLFERAHVRLEFQSFFIDEDLLAVEEDTASVDTILLDVQYRFGNGGQAGGSP
jgi:opacity protein-like surface antigen